MSSFNGNSDPTQIDDLRSRAKNQCNMRFNVTDAMPKLLDAGVRGVGELYGYCKIPGACEASTFDNVPYRDCLKEKFESPRPGGLGLDKTYCGVFRTSDDREKWRKCVEVSMIQQTADVLQQVYDAYVAGVAAIRTCRPAVKYPAAVVCSFACGSGDRVRVGSGTTLVGSPRRLHLHDTRTVGPFTVERWVSATSPDVSPAGMCECLTVVHMGDRTVLTLGAPQEMTARSVDTTSGGDINGDRLPDLGRLDMERRRALLLLDDDPFRRAGGAAVAVDRHRQLRAW